MKGAKAGIAAARSASSRRIAADLPPSSKVTRAIRSAAVTPICRPADTLPVKLILSTSSDAVRYALSARSAVMTLMAPLGRPASAAHSATMRPSIGLSTGDLRIQVQPAARAASNLWAMIGNVAFQGAIRAPFVTRGHRRPSVYRVHASHGRCAGDVDHVWGTRCGWFTCAEGSGRRLKWTERISIAGAARTTGIAAAAREWL